MFTEEGVPRDSEVEKCSDYESIEVPDNYPGPRLSFLLLPDHATALVEAFRLKQVSSPRNPSHHQLLVTCRGRAEQSRSMALDFGCLCHESTGEIPLTPPLLSQDL